MLEREGERENEGSLQLNLGLIKEFEAGYVRTKPQVDLFHSMVSPFPFRFEVFPSAIFAYWLHLQYILF